MVNNLLMIFADSGQVNASMGAAMGQQIRNEHNLVQMARAYAADVRPTRIARQQFNAIMFAQFENMADEAKQEIANALCLCHHIDKPVASLIAHTAANVSGRFLRSSPLLDEPLLSELALSGDFQRHLALARRQHLPTSVSKLLRDTCKEDINRALDLRQKPQSDATHSGSPRSSVADLLLDAARRRDLHALCETLKVRLSISQESAFILLSDKSSSNLIVAFKFCNLSCDQAWEAYTYLAPGLAELDGRKADFATIYDTHDKATCATIVKSWIMDDLIARIGTSNAANDAQTSEQDNIAQAVQLIKSA